MKTCVFTDLLTSKIATIVFTKTLLVGNHLYNKIITTQKVTNDEYQGASIIAVTMINVTMEIDSLTTKDPPQNFPDQVVMTTTMVIMTEPQLTMVTKKNTVGAHLGIINANTAGKTRVTMDNQVGTTVTTIKITVTLNRGNIITDMTKNYENI